MSSKIFFEFHISHRNHIWRLINMDKSELNCSVVYFPINETYKNGELVYYKDSRALIQIPIDNGFDFREVPIYYLKK